MRVRRRLVFKANTPKNKSIFIKLSTIIMNEELIVKDANGNTLQDGDTVLLTQDSKLKGSSQVLKRGDTFKNIRLTDNTEEIECKDGRSWLVLKTCYIKKNVSKKKKKKR